MIRQTKKNQTIKQTVLMRILLTQKHILAITITERKAKTNEKVFQTFYTYINIILLFSLLLLHATCYVIQLF